MIEGIGNHINDVQVCQLQGLDWRINNSDCSISFGAKKLSEDEVEMRKWLPQCVPDEVEIQREHDPFAWSHQGKIYNDTATMNLLKYHLYPNIFTEKEKIICAGQAS